MALDIPIFPSNNNPLSSSLKSLNTNLWKAHKKIVLIARGLEMDPTTWKIEYVKIKIQGLIGKVQSCQGVELFFRLESSSEVSSKLLSCGQLIPHLLPLIPIKSSPLAIEPDFSFLPELLAKQISLINHLAAKINAIFAREVYGKVIAEIEGNPIKAATLANANQQVEYYTETCARLEQEIAALAPS